MKDRPQHNKKMNRQIIEEAAYWTSCLEDGPLTPQEREAFALWLRGSPDHIKEFLLAQAISKDAEAIDPDQMISVDALLAKADADVIPLELKKYPSPIASSLWTGWITPRAAALAAVLAVALIFTAINLFKTREMVYATLLGEQHSFVLEDGSVVHLNTQSKIRVRYDRNSRAVDLLRGEALFTVAPNPDRPFRVHSGMVTTRAVGTIFNVYLTDKGPEVAVIEGKVNVILLSNQDSAILGMGEKASTTAGGKIETTKIAKPETIAAWRTRQLVFENTPLREIIREFNRYNQTQIRIEGTIKDEPHFSGVFNVDNPDAFLSTLNASDIAVIIRQSDNRIVIRLTPPNHPI